MDAHHAEITTDLTITASQCRTKTNSNLFSHSKMFSKTETFFYKTLYIWRQNSPTYPTLNQPLFQLPNHDPFYRTPQSFLYPLDPGELLRYR